MRAVLQRVKSSYVLLDNQEIANIKRGYNILLGVMENDSVKDVEKLVKKILNLRLFPNEKGKFDKNILQIEGEILVVSQFTLAANIKKGNRPDFSQAMNPKEAKELYNTFIHKLSSFLRVKSGIFGANMEVGIINDGPVAIIIDSQEL